ncbi:MAG: alpha/beta fold hydrolase [Oscillospiraceae bacterium]|nr:alpha/beta fold hydrolase [Oscillospiraceae bacterium]
MKKFTYPSVSGGEIAAYRWEPAGEPKVIFQIAHGVAEYALRYDGFARWLAERGALVVAEDHPGHGATPGTPLYFPGGWEGVLADIGTLYAMTRKEFPRTPYFFLGHSMGSFLLRDLLCGEGLGGLSGAIVCGTGWQPGLILGAGRLIAGLERRRVGAQKHSKLLHSLMFGGYNKAFRPNRTPNDWLNTDEAAVDAYTADPLCGGPESSALAAELLKGLSRIQKKSRLSAMPKDLPVHFIAGRSDPVGSMGKGVEQTVRAFRKAGMQNVTLCFFEGRHEILNEPNHTEVYEDVWNFVIKNSNFVTSL